MLVEDRLRIDEVDATTAFGRERARLPLLVPGIGLIALDWTGGGNDIGLTALGTGLYWGCKVKPNNFIEFFFKYVI